MIRKSELIDVPERRAILGDTFELRASGTTLKLEGYASVFDKGYEVLDGPPSGWTEVVNRRAFNRTLAESPDVHLLINHEGLPLARTKSGTLKLSADKTGLLVRADLDRRDPDVAGLQIKMERGDLDEMSFAFRVKAQSWNDDETVRTLNEVSLHKGDVSVVNFGANPNTSVSLRKAVALLAESDWGADELAELRSMSAQVDRAVAALRLARTGKDIKDRSPVDPVSSKAIQNLAEALRAVMSDGNLGGDVFDQDYQDNELPMADSALAQAVHDMMVNAGALCQPNQEQGEQLGAAPARDIRTVHTGRATLSLADAARICETNVAESGVADNRKTA